MKHIVHVSQAITDRIDNNSFRGEGRIERNILSALLETGDNVYLSDYPVPLWLAGDKPNNLYSFDEFEKGNDTVIYYAQGVPTSTNVYRDADIYILHWFNFPQKQPAADIRKLIQNKHVLLLVAFKYHYNFINKTFGSDNTILMQNPAMTAIDYRERDSSVKYLLWSYRNFYSQVTSNTPWVLSMFGWCSAKMQQDESLILKIVVGLFPEEGATQDRVVNWFWGLDVVSPLKGMEDRVDVLYDVDWHVMMDLYSKTLVVISPSEPVGAAPFEAAINSVPIVMYHEAAPYSFDGVLTYNNMNSDFIPKLDKLINDKDFYDKVSRLYYNYGIENVSYSSYISRIRGEIIKRGWVQE